MLIQWLVSKNWWMFTRVISVKTLCCEWGVKWRTATEIQTLTCLRWCSSDSNHHPELVTSQQSTTKQGVPIAPVSANWKNKRSACQLILDNFDLQYSNELTTLWGPARQVLLDPSSWQYGVMLNRFTTVTDVKHILKSKGFSSLVPQTDISTISSDATTNQPSNQGAGNGALSQPHSISKCHNQSDNHHLYKDTTSQSLHPVSQLEPHSAASLPPSSLQCYIHHSAVRFPSQSHWPGKLKQYYLLNAASLLPVLALQVKNGEKVLDLCSAPGGKALAIMQTANPGLLCCNELDPQRCDWLEKTLESYLPQSLSNRVVISNKDGRLFGQNESATYDKILVDAPCSNDRSWLYSSSDQQAAQRLEQRARLPRLQAQLLRSALQAVRPGGAVVYSTCTLSQFENQAVVEAVQNMCPWAEPEDLWEELIVPFSDHFTFSSNHQRSPQCQHDAVSSLQHKHGILVVPQPGRTWGPMFVCRIRRTH